MNIYFIFYAFALSGVVSLSQSTTPIFKHNAADFIKVSFKKTIRRGVAKEDFTKIEIEARPMMMVYDASSIDKNMVTLEIKSGDGEWTKITNAPSMRGGVYKWIESDVEPCLTHSIRIWVHGVDAGENSFIYPDTLAAASLDDIATSGYRPKKPKDVKIVDNPQGQIEVSWTPSKCASMYDVTYQKVTGGEAISKQVQASHENSILLVDGLVSCSEFEIRVSAVIGDEYSDEAVLSFTTAPEINAAQRLEPLAVPSPNSVIAKWKGFEKLSCISKYIVTICKEGEECSKGETLERDDSLQFIEYKSESNLEECSEYSLKIKPSHDQVEMDEKVVTFRTQSNPIDDVASLVLPVHAEAGDEQMVTVRWNAVKCANHYEVFQRVNIPDGIWERIGTTSDNYFKQKGVPCTEYKYGVKVTVDDQESDIVEIDQAIMTKLDETIPYAPSNLEIIPTVDGANLSWDHSKCIQSYRLRACKDDGHDQLCEEYEGIVSGSHKTLYTIQGLHACSDYQLQIFPSLGKTELNSESKPFKTASPAVIAPELTVKFNEKTNQIDFDWAGVQCATEYQIHQRKESANIKTVWKSVDEDQQSASLGSLEPCVKYSYAISVFLGSEESEHSSWQEVSVPPMAEHPILVIEEKTNGSVTFVMNNNEMNRKCKVDQYHVKYNTEEDYINPKTLEDGKIKVLVQKENTEIEGRIRYEGYASWSPWISSFSPLKEMQRGEEIDFLLPIIIGSVIAIAVISLVIFFIVRSKKSQMKYDAEKAEGNTEESKKLNEESGEKITKINDL